MLSLPADKVCCILFFADTFDASESIQQLIFGQVVIPNLQMSVFVLLSAVGLRVSVTARPCMLRRGIDELFSRGIFLLDMHGWI